MHGLNFVSLQVHNNDGDASWEMSRRVCGSPHGIRRHQGLTQQRESELTRVLWPIIRAQWEVIIIHYGMRCFFAIPSQEREREHGHAQLQNLRLVVIMMVVVVVVFLGNSRFPFFTVSYKPVVSSIKTRQIKYCCTKINMLISVIWVFDVIVAACQMTLRTSEQMLS